MAQPAAGLIDSATPLRAIPVAPSEPSVPIVGPDEPISDENAVRAVCDEPLAGRVRAPTLDHSDHDLDYSDHNLAGPLDLLTSASLQPPEVGPATPSADVMSDRPDLVTRALLRIGKVAWRVERRAYRRRLLVLTFAGLAVFGSWRLVPPAYPIAVLCYGCLLWLLLVTKLWWIRGDDGAWNWSSFVERLTVPIRESVVGLFEVETLTLSALLARLGVAFSGVGIFLMVFAAPLASLAPESSVMASGDLHDHLSFVEQLGVGATLVGVVLWGLSRLGHRSPAAMEFAMALRQITAPATAIGAIDLNEPLSAPLPVDLTLLADLLRKWKPKWNSTRAGYEASLVRYLRKTLPGIPIASRRPLETREGNPVGMLDVVIDDLLVIELWRRFDNPSDIEHALWKVSDYAEAWQGPLVLLVCETRRGFATAPWTSRIAVLQAVGRAVFALAAGKRL
jgi:hypothetical protein